NKATIDGKRVDPFASGTQAVVEFPGTPLKRPWHRRLEEMLPCPVPGDAEAIYEATCFAADNNCLETRCLTRAGPSQIPQVQQARDAFFQQNYFINRGVWDGYAFDGDIETSFQANMDRRINGGALRVDFGEVITLDQIVIKGRGGVIDNVLYGYKPVKVEISTDFVHWTKLDAHLEINLIIDVQGKQARCFRMDGTPESVIEFEGYREGKLVDRTKWRASNLFSLYEKFPAARAWSSKFVLDELAPNSYIAVALNGHHGHEGAYVGFKINDRYVGAPDRAPSYPCKPWECGLRKIDKNYTYFLPVTEDMIGCEIEVVALAMGNQKLKKMKPEAWITCYPNPFLQKELVLEMKNEKKAP
nr:discoidin domain-containing protein [Candidatus Sigynarchaeota archaeon]